METIFDKPLDKQVTSNTQAIANLETAFEPFEQVRPYVGGMVNLSGYNTENNPYTCPTNGYIRLTSSGEAVYIVGKASEYAIFLEGNGKAVSAYAVKGMKFFVNGSSARFLPLTE